MRSPIVNGYRKTWRNPGLITLLWMWNLTLGAVAALPAWVWWNSAFSRAPEGDRLLDGFNLGILAELAQYDRSPVWSIVLASFVASLVIALVGNAFLTGGMLEVLLDGRDRVLLRQFFRGAGHYFRPYLLLTTLSVLVGGLLALVVSAVIRAALRGFAESGWEPAAILVRLTAIGAALCIAVFFYAALDYSRIELAQRDLHGVLRTWISGLVFVTRNAGRAAFLMISAGLALAVLLALYATFRNLVPSSTWPLILLMIAVQQTFVFLRIAIRVALLVAEADLWGRTTIIPIDPII